MKIERHRVRGILGRGVDIHEWSQVTDMMEALITLHKGFTLTVDEYGYAYLDELAPEAGA